MRALSCDRAGASPVVRLAFVYGLELEPSYFVAWQVVRDFVLFLQSNSWFRLQRRSFFSLHGGKKTYGPFACFLRVLLQLGWSLDSYDTLCSSSSFSLSLLTLDLPSVRKLFGYSWSQMLTSSVIHREGFHHLFGINTLATSTKHTDFTKAQISLLNCIKDGTCYLRSFKSKVDSTLSAVCPCGLAVDSLHHRALECPRFRDQRVHFADVVSMRFLLPDCMTHHGLCPENCFQHAY